MQDFVRSGQWSDVGDLQNTGLKAVKNREGVLNFYTPEEFEASENAARGFAHGGSVELNNAARGSIQAKPVKTVQDIQAIITQLSERQSHA